MSAVTNRSLPNICTSIRNGVDSPYCHITLFVAGLMLMELGPLLASYQTRLNTGPYPIGGWVCFAVGAVLVIVTARTPSVKFILSCGGLNRLSFRNNDQRQTDSQPEEV